MHPHEYGLLKAAYSVNETLALLSLGRTNARTFPSAPFAQPDHPCAFDDLLWSVSIGNQLLQLQSSLPLEHKSRLVMIHPRNESRSY
jgi:hypothetical protein